MNTPKPDETETAATLGTNTTASQVGGGLAPATHIRYIGDYEILQELARGGMGVVFRARQVSLDRAVAVKMMLSGELATEEQIRRFRREAEAVAALDHPNIVPIYEVGEHEGRHYFSMKLVEGSTLAQRLPTLATQPRVGAKLLATVCRAVAFAHARGILHRDLKPSNVLLDRGDCPYVTDFGLARRDRAEQSLTGAAAVIGTPSYMSPEQAAGDGAALSVRSDVYSLGAILYELLTSRPPFRAPSTLETLRLVLQTDPVPPRAVRSTADPDLETIALKCLAKNPSGRYDSALALGEELERWLRGEPIHARPTPRWERAGKWLRRHPARAVALALAAVVPVLGTALAWQARESQQRAALASRATLLERTRSLAQRISVLRPTLPSGSDPTALQGALFPLLFQEALDGLRSWVVDGSGHLIADSDRRLDPGVDLSGQESIRRFLEMRGVVAATVDSQAPDRTSSIAPVALATVPGSDWGVVAMSGATLEDGSKRRPESAPVGRFLPSDARFTMFEGRVEFRRGGTDQWETASPLVLLREHDLLRTGPDSRAELMFFGGEVMTIQPNTLMSVERPR